MQFFNNILSWVIIVQHPKILVKHTFYLQHWSEKVNLLLKIVRFEQIIKLLLQQNILFSNNSTNVL